MQGRIMTTPANAFKGIGSARYVADRAIMPKCPGTARAVPIKAPLIPPLIVAFVYAEVSASETTCGGRSSAQLSSVQLGFSICCDRIKGNAPSFCFLYE